MTPVWDVLPPVTAPDLAPDLPRILPLAVLMAAAMLVLVVGVWNPRARGRWLAGLSLGGLALAAVALRGVGPLPATAFGGLLAWDAPAVFLAVVLLGSTALVVLLAPRFLRQMGLQVPEVYALLLFALLGMLLLVLAADLVLAFVGLEIMSVAAYVLAGLDRSQPRSVEAGIKYFILGGFSSAILLYGVALVYGATGGTAYADVAAALGAGGQPSLLLGAGLVLVCSGLGFKVAVVPFHLWAPDVYQGAPAPVSAFMASAVKVASFAVLLRFVAVALLPRMDLWGPGLAVLAGLTMVTGNVAALVQGDLKRLLAFSSVGQAGYLLMALAGLDGGAGDGEALRAVLFYLLAYAVMTLGAFAVVVALVRDGAEETAVTGLRGLARRRPWVAAGLGLCLLSLAGIPPTVGFVGKLFLFMAAVRADLVPLAVVGVLSAAVGAAAYLKPVVAMVQEPGAGELDVRLGRGAGIVLALAAAAVVVLGLFPDLVAAWCPCDPGALAGGR